MLEPHPLAELFPMMEGEQFAALVSDIRENGLREPIITHEGKILDGRNRYAACNEVGVEPMTREWDQRGDLLDYVISKNLNRRHLNEAQRAMVANKIATMRKEDTLRQNRSDMQICTSVVPTRARAAKLLNVSDRNIAKARVVAERGIPELRAAAEAGEVSLCAAEKVARQPHERQREIVMRGEKAIVAEASAIRRARKPRPGASTHRLNADIWIAFRDVMEGITGMPLASDVAAIVRAPDKAKTTDCRLERAIRWLGEFDRAWREVNGKDRAALACELSGSVPRGALS